MADQRIKPTQTMSSLEFARHMFEYHGSTSTSQGQHSQAGIKKRHGHRQMKLSEAYHPDYRKRGGH